ncbi:alpha/beta-hydrolase family protein [Humibacillus xanthopallidus]|uniref:alpha/beta-hydrolase family protein n=1 Tax=Humibacillus xanthopallidus TaxID=412689 RepID=UPI00384B0560
MQPSDSGHTGHTGQQVGLVMAAAMTPPTLAPSLSKRSWQDQGVITGLSTGSHYLMTLGAQDVIDVVAGLAATSAVFPDGWSDARRRSVAGLVSELGAVPLGLGLTAYLDRAGVSTPARGAARQAAWRLGTTALCGCVLLGSQAGARALDRAVGADGRIAALPLSIPVGLLTAAVIERARASVPEPTTTGPDTAARPSDDVPTVPGLAAGAAVLAVLWGSGWVERWTAEQVRRIAPGPTPGSGLVWRLASHAAFAAAAGLGVNALWSRAMLKIEAGSSDVDPWMQAAPGVWTHPMVSGDPASLVSWDSLGREGRRHAVTFVRPEVVVDPPPLPGGRVPDDLSIPTVMGEPARAHPVQVFVGLDSAPTPTERVELAIAEMDRTDAWSRSMLMLVSPTGTGYVNYVAVAAAQYLTRGDVASVTMQYSKRPSPLSLGKVRDAREQNRLLWLRILERVRAMPPDRRPRVVLFGESLGAHTSQDVLLGWGTLGPQALGIDRALWIGTPAGSKWMREVTGAPRPDVDPALVAVVNDHEQFLEIDDEARARVRYVLLSHDNDGVTRFGPDLLSRRPDWLGPDRPRTEEVPGRSPRGIPAAMRWRPVTTFFQTLVDMKNAQVAGSYAAWGHDYRADLPEFVRDVYDLPCTDEQLQRVRDATRRREEFREAAFD